MFNQKIKIMKKTLLLGTALVVGATGFAQSTASKAINPKYFEKYSVAQKNRIVAEPQPTSAKGMTINAKKNQSVSAACTHQQHFTSSWNCFGVGGGSTTSSQNCLSYNQDLNTLVWTQRGSKTWSLNPTSGCIQSTLINATTLAVDSVISYLDGNTTHHGRYPSGVILNPTGNTDKNKAFAVYFGQVTDGTNWNGTAYGAKPLGSKSALTHTVPSTADSLYVSSHGAGNIFGYCAGANISGAPANDVQTLQDGIGKTVVSLGSIGDEAFLQTTQVATKGAVFAKGVLNAAGNAVTWTADTTSLMPAVHKGVFGRNISEGRMAFGPDGLHGYVVFCGILNTTFGNKSDSSMTPILYATTDGGTTWTQKLAGYDWMCKHPEVEKNVGELVGNKRFYSFEMGLQGADVTVDKNNVLHFVTCVVENSFKAGPGGGPHTLDSIGIYSATYQYDFIHHHPIIWDFMTDGTDWKTIMVDSIMSADCGSVAASDTTAPHSSMGGSQILGVSSHITISRSLDGSKIFYGWADSDPSASGQIYNTQPDILMKGYDVATNKVTATKNVTGGLGICFYPYLSDISYYDGTQWVTPAVYTVGKVITAVTPQTTYDASSEADYLFTNCGTFANSEFSKDTWLYTAPTGTNCGVYAIEQHNNAFESSISNYPNPFNNYTTIAVTLTENKNVDVKVYNAIGALVFNKKINGNVGENTVSFDGTTLSSGVYYYTVTAGNQQATKKMVIQK
jgi:hypothetical protein